MTQFCDLSDTFGIRRSDSTLDPDVPVALTIGVFDGVHRGHQALIGQTVKRARLFGGRSVVLTFHPHPRAVLAPSTAIYELTSLNERVSLIAALGVDVVATLRFTRELSLLPADVFLDMVRRHINVRELVVGPDFALGYGRSGSVARLRELGAQRGFTVHTVEPVSNGGRVSSSRIRDLIAQGDVKQAAQLLGRYHRIEGLVVEGVRRGRTLGFPTANLELTAPYLLPADGIYAVYAELDGARLPAVANIGVRPTFGTNDRLVEVHILDFDRTMYGERLGVQIVRWLRDEVRFANAEALVAQMQRDAATARSILAAPVG